MSLEAVKIKIKGANKLRIRGRSSTGTPVTMKSNLGGASDVDSLTDVDVETLVDGATIIYNETTGKYVVKKLDIDLLAGEFHLDCGEF